MAGIVFFRTRILKKIQEFYTSKLGMKVWLEQEDCTIFQHDNLLVGFCKRDTCEIGGMITLFYNSKSEVDALYSRLRSLAEDSPRENQKYKIYQFFAEDPEGRTVEFQYFLHSIPPI